MKLKQILTKLFFKTNTNQSTERTEAIPKAQCKIELLEPRVMLSATQHSEVLVDGNFDSLDNFDNVSPEEIDDVVNEIIKGCLLYTSPSPRDATLSRMPSSA